MIRIETSGRSRGLFASAVVVAALGLGACASPKGDTRLEKQEAADRMYENTIAEVKRKSPSAARGLDDAVAHAAFSNVGVTVIFVGGGGGYGVAVDGANKRTYMKMIGGEVGLGLGIKDFRIVIAFYEQAAYEEFLAGRFDLGAQGDAAAAVGDGGGAVSTATHFRKRSEVWQFTEQGVMLAATIKGVKFSIDHDMN